MRIAVTGHTKGIGLEFVKQLEQKGHTVQGYSRTNGYDLRDWAKLQIMLNEIEDFDMLISCAKPDFVQTVLLYEAFKLWFGKPKTIINISSALTYFPLMPDNLKTDPMMHFYKNCKTSLNEACAELSSLSHDPKVILIKPGHLYSQEISEQEQTRLSSMIDFLLETIDRANTSGFALKELTLV